MERAMSPFLFYTLAHYRKDNMRFYKVESDYLNYLRLYEPRIPYTYYGDYHYKPFLGILFKTDDLNYITHLTSYKPEKHGHKASFIASCMDLGANSEMPQPGLRLRNAACQQFCAVKEERQRGVGEAYSRGRPCTL